MSASEYPPVTSVSAAAVQMAGDDGTGRPSHRLVGMICFLASEVTFFAAFLVAYGVYCTQSISGPQPNDLLEFWPATIAIIVLVITSLGLFGVPKALLSGQFLLAGFLLLLPSLGSAWFLYSTIHEWLGLINGDPSLTIRTNLFGTVYFGLLGLDLAHVFMGGTVMAFTCICAFTGRLGRGTAETLFVMALFYWFVVLASVVVWLMIYVVFLDWVPS
ncbi:MAG: hypothetical protein P8J86_08550 [Phycisphaerales bacterium]|nr:hypothetical protein [Phycisphaerales bacterium]